MEPSFSPSETAAWRARHASAASSQAEMIAQAIARNLERMGHDHARRARAWLERAEATRAKLADALNREGGQPLLAAYLKDAGERTILTLDALRERGDNDIAHERDGAPPVLIYAYETVIDGRDLKRPVNYLLLKILPPAGVTVHDWKRPYVIIDPRAGHGAGIGGFKPDSQVGVALRDGHPVYFVAFRPQPEPGQTLADVTRAEGEFVREVARRHPQAAKPIIVGNCQGGWATMLIGATQPDITGPLVVNGAPLAYWSGRVGENPMRYSGGLLGGVTPVLFLSDIGHGVFDGAHLVSNFEMLNPSRNHFGKYYDLYSAIDTARPAFLEFERWWGGFHFMTEAEIRWIVEQLFVGNRLSRGEARLEHGRAIDLKRIRSPIIVFASHGDNITPPHQALDWILDTYADENEIRICGQRILYMIHEKVGHLGIFVSSSVAKKEHSEVASTMKTIEALPPGLYEMTIDEAEGEGVNARFRVSFQERTFAHLRAIDDADRREEPAFAAVDRLSNLNAEFYDLFARPLVQAMTTPQLADLIRRSHPARVQRLSLSSKNPALTPVAALARRIETTRAPLTAEHPLREMERLWADGVMQAIDFWRDARDAWREVLFLSIYASPMMAFVGRNSNFSRARKDPADLRFLPEVMAMLANVERGGYAEAVVRMMIVLADARGSVRRSRLERATHLLNHVSPFKELGSDGRAALIREQSVIVEFEREAAVGALTRLLHGEEERRKAVATVEDVAGPLDEMEPHTIQALQTFRRVLGLPPLQINGLAATPTAAAQAAAE